MNHITLSPKSRKVSIKYKHLLRVTSIYFFLLAALSPFALAGAVSVQINKTGTNTFDLIWSYTEPNASVRYQVSENGGPFSRQQAHEAIFTWSLTKPSGTYTYRFYGCRFAPPTYEEECETRNPSTASVTLSSALSKPRNVKISSDDAGVLLTWQSSPAAYYPLEMQIDAGSWKNQSQVNGGKYAYTTNKDGDFRFRIKQCSRDGSSDCSGWAYSSVLTLRRDVTSQYFYDALGRLTKVEDPLNDNREYQYDPAGNRQSVDSQ